MKLPSRHIIILLVVPLAALFGYQIYWLSGLYRSSIKSKESQIDLALQKADYAEMMDRLRQVSASGQHGSIDLDTGWSKDHVQSQVTVRTDPIAINEDGSKSISVTTIQVDRSGGNNTEQSQYAYAVGGAQEIAGHYQRGMHAGVDALAEVNFPKLDSILITMLDESGLTLPHRLQMLTDSTTLASLSTPGYSPSARAKDFDLPYGKTLSDKYQLTIEPLTGLVLREMSGVIAASLMLFLILTFSFWFLIHTMLKQKSLEKMKSDFTNNITHELKTPVAVAYAANDALLNFDAGNDPKKRREYLEISQAQLEKLEGMIEQILSMSMESRKTFELRRETIELEPLLQKLSEQHRLSAGKPCDIHIDVEEGLVLDADRFHLSNILSNLIDNAVKYSGPSVRIDITAKAPGVGTEIRVRDNGIGIATDKQKHIFEKFYRVPTGNIQDVKGYGLGLYYAKTMVEKHGGTITVSSTPGKGSEFILSF